MIRLITARILVAVITLAPLPGNAAESEMPATYRSTAIVSAEFDKLAPMLEAKGLKLGTPVYIAIYKAERRLELWSQANDGKFVLFKSYRICDVSGGLGPKQAEGDDQAPEGFYEIARDQLNPNSEFDLALNIGYPNAYDRAHNRTGSKLMIHGSCLSTGCYAMTDAQIEEIYTLVYSSLSQGAPSVPVSIFPFRMTEPNMAAHASSGWYSFWLTLKQGYDAFAATGRPPRVAVLDGRYVVSAD